MKMINYLKDGVNAFKYYNFIFKLSENIFINVEKRRDINGKIYYVNHKNRTTQWDDPRTQGFV